MYSTNSVFRKALFLFPAFKDSTPPRNTPSDRQPRPGRPGAPPAVLAVAAEAKSAYIPCGQVNESPTRVFTSEEVGIA